MNTASFVTISFTRTGQQAQALMALDALIAARLEATLDDPDIGFLKDEWPSMFRWWIEELENRLPDPLPKSWSEADKTFISGLIAADRRYFGGEPLEPTTP